MKTYAIPYYGSNGGPRPSRNPMESGRIQILDTRFFLAWQPCWVALRERWH